MQQSEVLPFLDTDWEQRSHRDAQDLLRTLGWLPFAQGDWAYAYRSPSRSLVARVAPFDLGYQYFVDLCSRCQGNLYLPGIELASRLEGGGHLTVLEHLWAADPTTTATFLHQWEHPDHADLDMQTLRREVEAMDQWGKQNKRWWVGIDIGDRHVLLSASGTPKVIDLFGLESIMVNDLIDNPREFSRHVPPDQCRYLLDMPDLQDPSHPADYRPRLEHALSIAREAAAR